MKAVIYARYSSDSQREESIEGQIRECTAFAEKNGITVLRHYIDRAYSAKTDNRPEFQNMIKDSGKKLFDMIIVWKLDRFARNRYDSARYKAQLKKNGVKVVSATEALNVKLAEGRSEADRLQEALEAQKAENQLLRARLLGKQAMEGQVSSEELEAMTDKESFDTLEQELEAFVGLYEKVWKQTKKKIRKDLINLKYIKGQSGKQ